MLARKISASSDASAGRNGRNASAGCARALMTGAPQGERVSPRAARSSRRLPGGAATEAIGFGEALGLAPGGRGVDQLLHRRFIYARIGRIERLEWPFVPRRRVVELEFHRE